MQEVEEKTIDAPTWDGDDNPAKDDLKSTGYVEVRDGTADAGEGEERNGKERMMQVAAKSASFCDAFLGNEGCARVAEEARMNTCLIRLDLKGNSISMEGVQAIADLLRVSRSLESLSLEWNNVGSSDSSVRVLASSLEANDTLVELDLRNNLIGPSGGVAIARALSRNHSLKHLDLRWNEVGNQGGDAFAACLEGTGSNGCIGNRSLLEVKLSGNKVSAASLNIIKRALDRNRHPDAELQVGHAKLQALAVRMRANELPGKERANVSSNMDKGKLSESELDDLALSHHGEDSLVFADRVVDLEMQLRGSVDAIASAQKEASAEQVKRQDAEALVSNLKSELAQQQRAVQRLEQELKAEEQKSKRVEEDSQKAQQALLRLSKQVDECTLGLQQARDNTSAEKARSEAAEEQLERARAEKRSAHDELDKEKAASAQLREELFRQKLAQQDALEKQRVEWAQERAASNEKLEAEMRARADDALKAQEQRLADRQSLEESHRKVLDEWKVKAERVDQGVVDAVSAERKRWEAVLAESDAKHTAELASLRDKHAGELGRQEQQHEARLKDAVEQAVEAELTRAVQKAVAEAAKDLEAEHKRALWRLEKEIKAKSKEEFQTRLDFADEEKRHIEQQLKDAKTQLLELHSKHAAQISNLKERMRQAVTETFTTST